MTGSEFVNGSLVEYCAAQRITFSRGRPYRKNSWCLVEQEEHYRRHGKLAGQWRDCVIVEKLLGEAAEA